MNESYFDTEWIGEYPSNWKLVGMTKYIDTLVDYRGKTPKKTDEGIFLVTAKNIKNGKIDYKISKEYISVDDYPTVMSRGLPKVSDVLFTTEAPLGEVANVDREDIALAQRVIKFRGKKDVLDNYFLKYWMLSKGFNQNLLSLATGSTALGIKASKLYNLRLLLPQIDIQRLIVDYLNKKIMDVDILTGMKEKQIKLLEEQRQAMITAAVTKGLNPNVKMKDSGIEWIGKIPEHWNLKKLKYISKIKTSNVNKKSTDGEKSVKLCNYTDVYYNDFVSNSIDFMQATATKEQIEKFTLKRDNVLITKDSENPNDIGIPAYVVEDFVDVVCGYHLTVLEPKKSKMLGKYLYYSIVAKNFQEQFHSKANGVTRYGLTLSSIGDSLILEPTIEEQLKIISKLDSTSSDYKSMKEKIKKQIIKLKEYRQSLIHETVTGKIPIEVMKSYLKEAKKDDD